MHKCQLGTKLKLLPVFAEVILAVLDNPIEIAKAEEMLRNRNQTEMLIRDAVITTSGFTEVILEVLNAPIGVAIVENMLKT